MNGRSGVGKPLKYFIRFMTSLIVRMLLSGTADMNSFCDISGNRIPCTIPSPSIRRFDSQLLRLSRRPCLSLSLDTQPVNSFE